MNESRLKRLAIVLPIIAILLAILAMPTMSQDSDPDDSQVTLEGYNVIKYDHSNAAPLKDAVRSIVQGEKVGDTCRFSPTRLGPIRPGESAISQRQLALNTETCESLVETGTPTERLRRPLYGGMYRSSGSSSSSIATNEGRSLAWAWLLTDWYADWRYYVRQETTVYRLLGFPATSIQSWDILTYNNITVQRVNDGGSSLFGAWLTGRYVDWRNYVNDRY